MRRVPFSQIGASSAGNQQHAGSGAVGSAFGERVAPILGVSVAGVDSAVAGQRKPSHRCYNRLSFNKLEAVH